MAPGFDYNVGVAHLDRTGQRLLGKAITAEPLLASVAVGQALSNPAVLNALSAEFEAFAHKWLAALSNAEQTGQPIRMDNEIYHIGVLSIEVLLNLAKAEQFPASAIISVRARDVVHTFRTDNRFSQACSNKYSSIPINSDLSRPTVFMMSSTPLLAASIVSFVFNSPAMSQSPDTKFAVLLPWGLIAGLVALCIAAAIWAIDPARTLLTLIWIPLLLGILIGLALFAIALIARALR